MRLLDRLTSRRARVVGLLVLVAVTAAAVVLAVLVLPDRDRPSSRPEGHRPTRAHRDQAVGARGDLEEGRATVLEKRGQVIEGMRLRGQVTILADDVTLRDVRVDSDAAYGVLVSGSHATLENVTIVGRPGTTLAGLAVDGSGSFQASRIDVSGSGDGVRLGDDCLLDHSFVHGLAGGADSHFDGVTADGARGWRITDNVILNSHPQTGAVWVGDPRFGPSEGVLSGNLLAGGGWTIYAGPGTGSGVEVSGNRFSTRYFRRSGSFGPVTNWVARGNTWTDNRWADGPRQGEAVPPGAGG